VKAVGTHGSGPNQFSTPHAITSDAQGNIYVADRGNSRIQVYDTDLNFKKTITGMGAPWSICATPGPRQYLYSGDEPMAKFINSIWMGSCWAGHKPAWAMDRAAA
jgi:hypothetical protein